jgi:hypothetical protein
LRFWPLPNVSTRSSIKDDAGRLLHISPTQKSTQEPLPSLWLGPVLEELCQKLLVEVGEREKHLVSAKSWKGIECNDQHFDSKGRVECQPYHLLIPNQLWWVGIILVTLSLVRVSLICSRYLGQDGHLSNSSSSSSSTTTSTRDRSVGTQKRKKADCSID